MIEFKNVSKSYDGGKHLSLDSLNLVIKGGEVFGLIGHNGAGKSTSLKMLAGILQPTAGNIIINGFDIVDEPILAKQQLGFVSDEPNAFLKFSAYSFLNFICDVFSVPKEVREEKIHRYASLFEIENVLYDRIASFSHGMRQKIFLVASLIHDPEVWVLDEPLTGLDPSAVYNLKQIMQEKAREGKTVLFSSHVLDVVEKICDRIAILIKGKLIFCGTIEEFKDTLPEGVSLEEGYLKLVKDYEVEVSEAEQQS